ncbi:MAG: glycosyltransferase family 1 protein [Chloroflexota bacterium]
MDSLMHVAFNGYFWDQERTGSGQYLRHLWSALNNTSSASSSHDAGRDSYTLLLPPGQGGDVPVTPGGRVAHGRALPVVGGRVGHLEKLYWEEIGVARLAKKRRADVLHVPYLSAPAPLPGLHSFPVVVTAHDMIPWVVPGYSGSAAVRLYLAVAAASVKRADLILADSEASRRDVIKVLRVSPKRVRTVYLGMEPHPTYTQNDLSEARARLGLPENYAFYLGGFDARKNVPLLLRAWRVALETLASEGGERPTLVIGGAVPEPGGVFPDVLGEAARLGLDVPGGPVRFIGRVSEEDKALLMAAARLFVYPSAYEGFGLDPLEAMSVGCPVVSSSGGSLAEVVGDGGLLVAPNDEGALAEAVVRAWRSEQLRAVLSQRGRERAKQFTWERTARDTERLYRAVVAKWSRGYGTHRRGAEGAEFRRGF